jgi:putative ABC transport system ATP-binding protein
VITHNAVISSMADRVVSLSDGRIAAVRRNERRMEPRELDW